MKIITFHKDDHKDGFTGLLEAFQLYWDEDERESSDKDTPEPSGEDGFADICQAFQLYLDDEEQDASQYTLLKLKSLVGLEEVKTLFIKTKARVETMKRQGVDLSKEHFYIDLIGNPGTGISTVERLYDKFLETLGVRGCACVYDNDTEVSSRVRLAIKLPDFSDDELLRILTTLIHNRFKKKIKVQGGIVGLYSRILVRRVGRGRGKKNFGNVRALETAFSKVCDRQADRLHRERLAGKKPNDLLFTKEDLIGPEPFDVASQSQAWHELQSMIGLEEVKGSIQTLFDRVITNYRRELQEKEPVQITLNRLFLGPPGTGKSTVGKLYGQILADLGLISSGEVMTKNPSDFIARYLGESENQTKKILKEAEGKVLIIDDAHMLYPGGQPGHETDSYRTAVIDTLVAEIQSAPGEDRCVILIGYPDQMKDLFQNSNPGLARRFPLEDAFHFNDFDDVQLGQILDLKLKEQELNTSPEGREVALEMLGRARDRPNFGNGGEVENVLGQAKTAYQKRVSKTATSEMPEAIVLEPQDFDSNYDRALHPSEKCKSLFSDLIGCEDIIAKFERYQQTVAGMRLHGIDPRPYIPFTFLFKGPPGTGKTTTARKVGQIFYDMGFLSRPEIIECSVSDLIAMYTGQTGPKVANLLERALGKVLFIDEAYRLRDGGYANEAVGELVDCLTKKRYERKIVVVLAGYDEDINKLMLANRGLRSRFATDVVFRRMRPEHCLRLLEESVGKAGIAIEGINEQQGKTRNRVVSLLDKLTRVSLWANGRDVEALGARIIVQVFQACGRDPGAAGPLMFTADEAIKLLEAKLEELEMVESEMVVSAMAEDHPDRAGWLSNHGVRLFRRYERTGNMDDLEAAISNAQQAVSATPKDHPDLAGRLNNLGSYLSSRYEQTGNMDDLEAAISNARLAVSATPEDHPDRTRWLSTLGSKLLLRYECTGNMDDLEAAISNAHLAISTISEDHPDRATMLNNLGIMLSSRYKRTGNIDDLEAAISNARLAVSTTPEDHPNRTRWLSTLGSKLLLRYECTGNMDDLEAAISNTHLAVSATPEDHPDRTKMLGNLGIMLAFRYERMGNMDDLEAAISNTHLAVSATPEGHPDRIRWLSTLGNMLLSRFERMGNMDDLEAAISNARLAVSTTPEGHPDRAGRLNNLGSILLRQFERTGNMDDLEAAILKTELAVSTTPEGHSDRAKWLTNLGIMLVRRYSRTGNMDDLEAAILKTDLAVSTTPEGHPDRAGWLNSLGNMLSNRYDRTGNMDDLEAAISKARLAVSTTPEGHSDRAKWFTNLGNKLLSRFERMGNMDDLEAAISNAHLAVSTTPEGHTDRAKMLGNLGNILSSRFERTGNMDDLEAAILKTDLAVSITPEGHPDKVGQLNNLGTMLLSRFERTGNMDDLETAILKTELAVSTTPEGHSDRAKWLTNLGIMLIRRYERTRNKGDREAALNNFEESTKCSSSVPLLRVRAARQAIRILQDLGMWERASRLAQDAVKLLPSVCGRYLNRHDQQHAVLQTSGLAADACSLSLKSGHVSQALQQVEFGRGLILGYLIDGRSDLSVLRQDHPDLANEFEKWRFIASRPIKDGEVSSVREQLMQERTQATRALEDCLRRIRQKHGHKRFLLQPALGELVQVAAEGPVIIVNVTDISSDAIMISRSGVRAIELPNMTSSDTSLLLQPLGRYRTIDETRGNFGRDIQSDKDAVSRYSVTFLSWLWTSCVAPILSELSNLPEFADSTYPRIWWIGTGVASSLPFHAAAKYPASPQEDTLIRTISSYTPTIKSLAHARSCATRLNREKGEKRSVLVVAMPETPGQKSLPGVAKERSAIQKALGDIFTVKALEHPSVEQVLGDMRDSDIVHFACHGSSDHVNPSNSHLLLQSTAPSDSSDPPGPSGSSVERLTVQEISDNQTLGKAQIAYLSACSTAEVKAGRFADEALHIVSAFQVAGFGHVIGSLWSADDDTCVQMAKFFYEYLTRYGRGKMTNRMVAEALRHATLQVRPGREARLWAPYIHSGA